MNIITATYGRLNRKYKAEFIDFSKYISNIRYYTLKIYPMLLYLQKAANIIGHFECYLYNIK